MKVSLSGRERKEIVTWKSMKEELFTPLYRLLRGEEGYTRLIFLCAAIDSSSYRYWDPENGEEFHVENTVRRSVVYTAMETTFPIVVNNVRESFIYNREIDDPIGTGLENIAAIPLTGINEEKRSFGALLLYRKKKFTKEKLDRVKSITAEFIERAGISFLGEDGPGTTDTKLEHIELEKANRFFSSVIHDIRTPMNAIMGFLELLQDEASDEQKEYLKAAYKSSEMVIALINDVLDMSKLSMGKIDLDLHFFSPMDELENTALLFHHSAIKKRIDFIVSLDPMIPYVIKSDPYRLKQIVNNLLSNAIKFTPEGGVVVLEMHYDPVRDSLSIAVQDTGIGISDEAQKYIFQPFRQASKSTSGQFGGTGLGLSISKQLSALLGGELGVESREGDGSRFTLTIPCRTVSGTPATIEADPNVFPPVCFVKGKKCRNNHLIHFRQYFEALLLSHHVLTTEELIGRMEHMDPETIYILVEADYGHEDFRELLRHASNRLIILETRLFPDIPKLPDETLLLNMPIFPKKLFDSIEVIRRGENGRRHFGKEDCRSQKVMLVDDNMINLKLMREVTQRMGHETVTAEDGEQAVKLFQIMPVDMILIDKNMPVMDGSEAIRRIRRLPGGDNVTIFGLTGESDPSALREMIDAGADDLLFKPIKIDRLRRVMCHGD